MNNRTHYSQKFSHLLKIILILGLALPAVAANAAERELVSAPPVTDPNSVFPEDNLPVPGGNRVTLTPEQMRALQEALQPAVEKSGGSRLDYDQIGGDDLFFGSGSHLGPASIDLADNGDVYVAYDEENSVTGWEIKVMWMPHETQFVHYWSTLSDPDPGHGWSRPQLEVVEGTVSGVHLIYRRHLPGGETEIRMIQSTMGDDTAAWSAETTVMAQAGINFDHPRFDTDVDVYDNYYMYVVAEGDDDFGPDIWFARSTTHGASFETPYMLATLHVADRQYVLPDISYGWGGHLHVTWGFSHDTEAFDESIRYRRASGHADAGLADWDNWITITPTNDGHDDTFPRVEASAEGDTVVVAYGRQSFSTGGFEDTSFFISGDQGVTFDSPVHYPDGPQLLGDLLQQPGTGVWMMVGFRDLDPCLYTSHVSDLTTWTGPETFQDEYRPTTAADRLGLTFDPSHDFRPAYAWALYGEQPAYHGKVYFDADWRNDPGFPNLEPGFPVDVPPAQSEPYPMSPPALVDIDQDLDLEIVFSDWANRIVVVDHEGNSLPGWPVDVGTELSDGPVAVGDLNGDGYPILVVGTADGQAYAYDHLGNLLPGWPSTVNSPGESVYVSIGALGGPYPRTIVCASDNDLTYRNRRGEVPTGAVSWGLGPGYDFIAPCAIGDIDLDGVAEVVGAYNTAVFAVEMKSSTMDFIINTGDPASEGVTLGDIDLDGDLEVLVPTEVGVLHLLDHTGVSVGGNWPFENTYEYALTRVALGQIRGTTRPEIVFGTDGDRIHVLYHDGTAPSGFPASAWDVSPHDAPVLGLINGGSGDVAYGSDHVGLYSWDNFGNWIPGWPYFMTEHVRTGLALGDLDLDGSNEMVILTFDQVWVLDLNSPVGTARGTWGMYGHDPQRTGCSDCPEDVVSAVDLGSSGLGETRVSFAGSTPNPVSGKTTFSFYVPSRAAVTLEIFDLRGARVALILREEVGPGPREIAWHGRDEHGVSLASGTYFARLQVEGPGVSESMTRKVTLLR